MSEQVTGTGSGARVGIVMGSDSDWPVMQAAAEACREFDVEIEADVVSAHRMPHEMLAYGEQAAELAFSYSAAKAAVISFTRSAAYELAEYGVRAVAITPGRVGTAIINQFSDELKSLFASEQLRNKMTEPEEIANVVAFLASDEANVINGTVVHVDDGYSAFKQRFELPTF